MAVGLWEGEGDGGFVVAGEFLGLDFGFDGGLHRGFDLEEALDVFGGLAGCVGGVWRWEVLLVDAALCEGSVLPCLVCGEGEDGGEELGDGGEDLVHGGLRGEAARGVWGIAIHAVFERVDVDGGEICGAELVDGVEDFAKLEGLVGAEAFSGDGVEPF